MQDKNNQTHHYRVRDKDNILKLISLFNGNIITKYKRIQFKLWVGAFNQKYKTNVSLVEPLSKISLNNAWLSGFTDAEGCFTCSLIKSKMWNSTQVIVR